MRLIGLPLFAAFAGLFSLGAPAAAQDAADAPANDEPSAICRFHGDGCNAPPSEWSWQRLEPRTGTYSVEIPCDERQAAAFGQIMAMGPSSFPAGSTRACMKASALFTATLIGLTDLPDDTKSPETDALLKGAPDLFTAITVQPSKTPVAVTTIEGRRVATRSDDKNGNRTKVAIMEVDKFAVIMLLADIRSDFPGTPEDADAATARFIDSLEITP